MANSTWWESSFSLERRLAGGPARWTYREIDPDVYGEELEQGPYAEADRIAPAAATISRP